MYVYSKGRPARARRLGWVREVVNTYDIDAAVPGDGNDRLEGAEIDTCRRGTEPVSAVSSRCVCAGIANGEASLTHYTHVGGGS